jgi:hypothetical protein
MSKGGAGKVYFVLYLAVILELLIIIVERDEAEEHLMAKQKESMKIVQSILSQLQTGTGVEGLSTRPQDQIVLKSPEWANMPGMDLIKEEREYLVEVGVTDVMGDLAKVLKDDRIDQRVKETRLKDFVLASNVREIYYQIWHSSDANKDVSDFPNDVEIADVLANNGGLNQVSHGWTLLGYQRASFDQPWLDKQNIPLDLTKAQDWFKTATPVYNFDEPRGDYRAFWGGLEGKVQFEYDHDTTLSQGTNRFPASLKVRSFIARFQPKGRTGVYKLHFYSKTNKILGIRRDPNSVSVEASDEEKVNIGTVQLSVKDLRRVLKELNRTMNDTEVLTLTTEFTKPDGRMSGKTYNEKLNARVLALQTSNPDLAREARLYGYINMILRPNQSSDLEQNQASMGFTVKVVQPDIPMSKPTIADLIEKHKVISGVKYVVIPFVINSFKTAPLPSQISIEPREPGVNIEVVQMPGQAASTQPGGTKSQAFELRISGLTSDGNAKKEYKVNFAAANIPMSDGTVPDAFITVYPAGLMQKNREQIVDLMDKRLRIGKEPVIAFQPSSEGEIPANQFTLKYEMDGQSNKFDGSQPLQMKLPCVPKGMGLLKVAATWNYRPVGSQYSEQVVLFEHQTSNAKKNAPTIDFSQASEQFDLKNLKLVISGISVEPPTIDCKKKADANDVKVSVDFNPPSAGKYKIVSQIDPEGGGTYKVTVQLKGPRSKFTGANLEMKVSATATGADAASETTNVSIPEFR